MTYSFVTTSQHYYKVEISIYVVLLIQLLRQKLKHTVTFYFHDKKNCYKYLLSLSTIEQY